jgi:hypothetical protein
LPPFFADKDKTVTDEEEKEQERLAKRFAKRARMQRLIEAYGDDEEFSQMRLIDEDESTRLELKKMKVCHSVAFFTFFFFFSTFSFRLRMIGR